jgi:hypothetical protein
MGLIGPTRPWPLPRPKKSRWPETLVRGHATRQAALPSISRVSGETSPTAKDAKSRIANASADLAPNLPQTCAEVASLQPSTMRARPSDNPGGE